MSKNVGKIFEESIKKSIPNYAILIRLNDSPQAFKQSNITRFTPQTPFDYIAFDTNSRVLYCWELKSTKNKSISFEDIHSNKQEKKMVHRHQILGLKKYYGYPYVESGFLFNFRHFEDDKENYFETTYYQSIEDFLEMTKKINKKSFDEINLIQNNAKRIEGYKKRTRWYFDLDSFLKSKYDEYVDCKIKNMNE